MCHAVAPRQGTSAQAITRRERANGASFSEICVIFAWLLATGHKM